MKRERIRNFITGSLCTMRESEDVTPMLRDALEQIDDIYEMIDGHLLDVIIDDMLIFDDVR